MPPPRALPRWLPYAAAGAWLLVGWLNLARGTAHAGVPYRPWAFDHHSYSDLIAMAGDRYFGGGRPLPYLEDRIEYPPLLGVALWLPSFVPGGPLAYFTAGYLLLAACGLASVALLARLRGASAWWLAASPALAYYGGLNWDLLPIALWLAAVAAAEASRPAWAGGWVALGASAKLWPVSLVPTAAAFLARRRDRASLGRAAAVAVAVTLAVNLPLALLAPERWSWFWRFNATRAAENSIWEALRHVPPLAWLATDAPALNALTALLLLGAVAFAATTAYRAAADPEAGRRAMRLGAAFIVVAWIATSKVWSPQYALWACAAGALAAAPRWLFLVHAVLAAVDYHVAFETRSSRGVIRYFDGVYTAEEVVRFAAYVLLAAWIGRAAWRAARPEQAPAARGAGTGA
jgi:hypothetical protein